MPKEKSRAINTTKEQDDFRASILLGKPRKEYVKREFIKPTEEVTPREVFMSNCLWWINEYREGRCDRERAIKAAEILQQHCTNFIIELKRK